MAYYDRIAKQWHRVTGYKGGPFKELILNKEILSTIGGVADRTILELGAGNGYFLPLMLRHFSGQLPTRIVVTDQSEKLLELAQRQFKVTDAEYLVLDVRDRFPFANDAFDLVLATMVFNELPTPVLHHTLEECHRVLKNDGQLVATVIHPKFIESLARRGQLRRFRGEIATMPGTGTLRLPVVQRRSEPYPAALTATGFTWQSREVLATPRLLNAKPGLRKAGAAALAIVFDARKTAKSRVASMIANHRKHEFFDHTADVGIRVRGATTLPELFAALARGLTELLVEDSQLTATQTRAVKLSAPDVESLLLVWLQELLFLFSTERFVPVDYEFDRLTSTTLTCRMAGETFDPVKHVQGREVKAITRHQLQVRQQNGQWSGQVVVDI